MVDLHLGQGRGGQCQLQPQAPRAAFQAWTPNNHALFVAARGKSGVGHSRHEWERTGKGKERFLWVTGRVFREVKADFEEHTEGLRSVTLPQLVGCACLGWL